MARKAMILKQKEEPKFSTRYYNRCKICGRPHAYLRDYGVCRICFRVNLFAQCCVSERLAYTMYAGALRPCLARKSSPIRPQMTGGVMG